MTKFIHQSEKKMFWIICLLSLILGLDSTSILDQSKFCFSYPHTISLSNSLSSSGSSPTTGYYTVNGDLMISAALSTPTKTKYGAVDGSVYSIGSMDVTNAMNNLDILQYHLQYDLPCEFYIDSITSTTVTFYRGVNCPTANALNGAGRFAFTNSVLRFNATTETNESKWFIIKFPQHRPVEFDNVSWDFVGTMDPAHDILWVHWGFNILMRQLNVLLPTQDLYGVFVVPGFTYSTRVDNVMHVIYGGMFTIGNVASFANSSIINDGYPLFVPCEPITHISWGDNATLSEVIFVATEILRGTAVSNGNNSVNVYGSYAQEFPYLSSNIYTNWYIRDQVYFPLTDSTYDQVKSQRVGIFSDLGKLPCDVRGTSSSPSSILTIYPGSTCLGNSFLYRLLDTIIFDGRNETNSTFYVRTRGFTLSPLGNFQFLYINGANRTRMHWTDTKAVTVPYLFQPPNITLEGNFYFHNFTLNQIRVTVVGSLFAKYVSLNDASTLNVYPFPDGSLTGDIYNK